MIAFQFSSDEATDHGEFPPRQFSNQHREGRMSEEESTDSLKARELLEKKEEKK